MIDISEFVFEILREDGETVLSQGRRDGRPSSILVLAPLSKYPALKTLSRLDHEYALRENSVVVFVVTALQLGLALYLASWLIVLADLHSHPREILTFAWKEWPLLERFVMSHWFSKLGQVAVFLWTSLFAAVVVLIGRLISFVRSRV